MKITKAILLSSIAGSVIPALFIAIVAFNNAYDPHSPLWKLQVVQLLLWPSSIFMMATAAYSWSDPPALQILGMSILANVILYVVIGSLIWLGVKKQRWILYVLGVAILSGWYKLVTL